MEKDPNRTVRDWTEEDERKYREMLATPVKRLTEEEMLKLAAVSPHPPLGASLGKDEEGKKLIEKLKNPPQFEQFDSEEFTKVIGETAQKTAQVSHDLEMKRIKAKLIADLCVEMTKNAGSSPIVRNIANNAREIADKALENI